MTNVLAATLASGAAGVAIWFGGMAGLAYAALYLLALAPGVPLGWRLFGRYHPVAWVAGSLMGYGITALAFWIPIRLGIPHPVASAVAWAAATGLVWGVHWRSRPVTPLVALPHFGRQDAARWLLALHLVLILVAVPFGRVGERDAFGARLYRAYFTADFVWHAALTQEVARFELPLRNPYLASQPIHYYWTYFLVPAVLSGPAAAPLVPVETALKITALGTALLLFSLVFFAAWSACGNSSAAVVASVIALVAPSFEGTYYLIDAIQRGVPFSQILHDLRDVNIDAITNWEFQGLRVDGLIRSMWYTPQHATSFALGLVAVFVASRLTSPVHRMTPALTGIALGLSVAMNPFLGAAFCAIYGVAVVIHVMARRLDPLALAWQVLAVVPVMVALAWCFANHMSDGAGSALFFGVRGYARHSPWITLFLSLGGLLCLAVLGLWPWRRVPLWPAFPALPGAVLGLFLMYFVSLSEASWVGFRAGNILQVTLPMLVARAVAGLSSVGARGAAIGISLLVLLAGAPTTLIDVYNAQDTSNSNISAGGFLWTVSLSPAQQAGFDWVRQATAADAIVQADPIVRGRQNWSVIPSFAGRRMAAGQPISLLPDPEYTRLSDEVHELVTVLPANAAHARARGLHIDYLWVDEEDGPAADPMHERFATRPDLFTRVFRRGAVVVYRVVPIS